MGGLGSWSDRRYGRAFDRSLDVGAEPGLSDQRRNAFDSVQPRVVSERDDDGVRISGAQSNARQIASRETDLVRRRIDAAEAGRAWRRGTRQRRRRAAGWKQGKAAARNVWNESQAAAEVITRIVWHAREKVAAHPGPASRIELGECGQGKSGGVVSV